MSTGSPGSVSSGLSGPFLTNAATPSDDDEEVIKTEEYDLANPMDRLDIGTQEETFYGKSSDMVFIRSALSAKAEYSSAGSKDTAKEPKRPEFWEAFSWQRLTPQHEPPLQFPSRELMSLLMGHFFEDYQIMFPLLHRPTFERHVANGRHLFDVRFGLLLLSVCAIGSRYVDVNNPRVVSEGAYDPSESDTTKKHSLGWRWYRQIGYRALQADFSSSPDVCQLQLVVGTVRRPEGTSASEQEQIAVKEFDRALNEWIDNIPDHIRWNPHMHKDNKFFFNQSCFLHINYYWVQIQVHRSFISGRATPDKAMAFASLAVCANAARSCSHVMELQVREGDLMIPFPETQMVLFNSAIVLLFNIWRGKSIGITPDPVKELNDVLKCVNILQTYEGRWQMCGRLCDILMELVSFSDLDTAPSQSNNLKRPRSAELSTGEASQSESPFGTGTSESIFSSFIPSSWQWAEDPSSGLPLYTKDLGRLPLHGTTSDMFGDDLSESSSQVRLNPSFSESWSIEAANVKSSCNGAALAMWSGTPGEYG
ncbi:Gypsy retrotransposon integrase-like protein 1 [Marasmius crinis-equi]|uniref:Gypsy retrotransposon integrase-like protein 1 n=1 Tax=Marasmius crinis-equi TaxID=585013 RepID=A0ABR3FLS6_9AGAR